MNEGKQEKKHKGPGYTGVPHKVLEHLAMFDLSSHETRVIFALWRATWGWHKKSDQISLSNWCERTRLSHRAVVRALQRLERRCIILVDRNPPNLAEKGNSYQFNREWKEWVQLVDKSGDKPPTGSVTGDTTPSVTHDTHGGVSPVTLTIDTLKIIRQNNNSEADLFTYPQTTTRGQSDAGLQKPDWQSRMPMRN